jgi:hypothetical protein
MKTFIESKHFDGEHIVEEIIRTDDIKRIYISQPSETNIIIEMEDGTAIRECYKDMYSCKLRYCRLMEALAVWKDPFDKALKRDGTWEGTDDGGPLHQTV